MRYLLWRISGKGKLLLIFAVGDVMLKMESVVHALFECKEVKKIWAATRFGCLLFSRKFSSVMDVFSFLLPLSGCFKFWPSLCGGVGCLE
jgi:hypothetical protein